MLGSILLFMVSRAKQLKHQMSRVNSIYSCSILNIEIKLSPEKSSELFSIYYEKAENFSDFPNRYFISASLKSLITEHLLSQIDSHLTPPIPAPVSNFNYLPFYQFHFFPMALN